MIVNSIWFIRNSPLQNYCHSSRLSIVLPHWAGPSTHVRRHRNVCFNIKHPLQVVKTGHYQFDNKRRFENNFSVMPTIIEHLRSISPLVLSIFTKKCTKYKGTPVKFLEICLYLFLGVLNITYRSINKNENPHG